jgi:hypothetical protein
MNGFTNLVHFIFTAPVNCFSKYEINLLLFTLKTTYLRLFYEWKVLWS